MPLLPTLALTNLLAAASTVAAQPEPSPARLTFSPTSPAYAALDERGFVMRFYPAEAVEMEQSGTAVLDCQVGLESRPENCAVVHETPEGFYFGRASLRMIPQFVVSRPDGQALQTGERFRYTFVFRVPAPIPVGR